MTSLSKMLVPELRERIRAARQRPEPEDPLSIQPPNISRMSKVELQIDCETRGLPYTDKTSRGAMIVMIQDDVEARAVGQLPDLEGEDQSSTASGTRQTKRTKKIKIQRRKAKATKKREDSNDKARKRGVLPQEPTKIQISSNSM